LALRLITHQSKCTVKARIEENLLRILKSKYGVLPVSLKNIWLVIIQSKLLYR
jgi:hypothetical protein